MLYKNLRLISLDAEGRARTCGYWYLVQSSGGTAHTAFRSMPALLRWLGERGLCPSEAIPPEGVFGSQPLIGTYRATYANTEAFAGTIGIPTWNLHNGRYVAAKITIDADGLSTIHTAHFPGAPELPYRLADDFFHGAWATPARALAETA